MPSAYRLAAPAKLNLSLAVTARRRDGYHELAGVMVLLELGDTLRLAPGPSALRVEGHGGDPVPTDPSANLAWRGAVAGARRPAEIGCLSLWKRIPVAAGLGGGSSDAAAGWRLVRRMAGASERPDGETVVALAGIGADVPFFAASVAAAYVTGVGERVEPLPAPRAYAVVALPAFRLSTAAVFAELRRADWSPEAPPRDGVPGRNDLLAPALRLRPELGDLLTRIQHAGGEPHLTGSGPACFTLTHDPERASAIARALRGSGVDTIETKLRNEAAVIDEATEEQEEDG